MISNLKTQIATKILPLMVATMMVMPVAPSLVSPVHRVVEPVAPIAGEGTDAKQLVFSEEAVGGVQTEAMCSPDQPFCGW